MSEETISVTELSNTKERKYYFNFPHIDFYEGDTWRLVGLFEEAKQYYENAGKNVDDDFMEVLKKVWINFNISSTPERNANKRHGLLSEDYLLTLATDECKCCGRKIWYGRCHNGMTPEQEKEGYVKPSLDRIDNSLSKEQGYVDTNIWIICKQCNTKKSNALHPEELTRIADAWDEETKNHKELYEKFCNENLTSLNQDMVS